MTKIILHVPLTSFLKFVFQAVKKTNKIVFHVARQATLCLSSHVKNDPRCAHMLLRRLSHPGTALGIQLLLCD